MILHGNWPTPMIPNNSLNHELIFSTLKIITEHDINMYQEILPPKQKLDIFHKEYTIDNQNTTIVIKRLRNNQFMLQCGDLYNSARMQFTEQQLLNFVREMNHTLYKDVVNYI